MKLYRVTVDCWSIDKHGAKPKRVTRQFIVDATADAAVAAVEYAEKTAAFGPKWVGFEWRSSAPVTIPLELKL